MKRTIYCNVLVWTVDICLYDPSKVIDFSCRSMLNVHLAQIGQEEITAYRISIYTIAVFLTGNFEIKGTHKGDIHHRLYRPNRFRSHFKMRSCMHIRWDASIKAPTFIRQSHKMNSSSLYTWLIWKVPDCSWDLKKKRICWAEKGVAVIFFPRKERKNNQTIDKYPTSKD